MRSVSKVVENLVHPTVLTLAVKAVKHIPSIQLAFNKQEIRLSFLK